MIDDEIRAMRPEGVTTVSIAHTWLRDMCWFNVSLHWKGDGTYNPCVSEHADTVVEAFAKADAARIAKIGNVRTAQEIAALEVASWGIAA